MDSGKNRGNFMNLRHISDYWNSLAHVGAISGEDSIEAKKTKVVQEYAEYQIMRRAVQQRMNDSDKELLEKLDNKYKEYKLALAEAIVEKPTDKDLDKINLRHKEVRNANKIASKHYDKIIKLLVVGDKVDQDKVNQALADFSADIKKFSF